MKTSWREELAWAAGFFDGEGCFSNFRRPNVMSVQATIAQTNVEPLERFRAAVGGVGRLNGPYIRGKNKPVYYYAVSGWKNTQAVAALLWAFLSSPKRLKYQQIIKVQKVEYIPNGTWRKKQTHCKRGHEFSKENTYWYKNNTRGCRACHRHNQLLYTARRKSRLGL